MFHLSSARGSLKQAGVQVCRWLGKVGKAKVGALGYTRGVAESSIKTECVHDKQT